MTVNDVVRSAFEEFPTYSWISPGSTTNFPRLSQKPTSLRSTVKPTSFDWPFASVTRSKPAQPADRLGEAGHRVVQVELHDLVAGARHRCSSP